MTSSVNIDNSPTSVSFVHDFLNKFISEYNLTKIDKKIDKCYNNKNI